MRIALNVVHKLIMKKSILILMMVTALTLLTSVRADETRNISTAESPCRCAQLCLRIETAEGEKVCLINF